MKRPDNKPRGPQSGTRTGPRARAAQDRFFGDPYQRADRPGRPLGPRPDSGPRPARLRAPGGDGIRLDPDVARVFRTAESVNEALRLVMRLAKVAGGAPRPAGRPTGPRDRAPAGGPPRYSRDDRSSPAARPPRFTEES